MSLTKKIVFNTIVHTAGKFGSSLVGIVIVGILTRYLGVAGYGAYTTIFAYLFFFAILSDLGLYVVTVNEMNRSEFGEERFFNNIFTLRLVTAIVLLTIATLLVWFFPYSGLIKTGVIVAAMAIFLNLLDQIIVAFFQTKINMKRVAVAELVGKTLTLLLIVGVVQMGGNLIQILGAVVLGFMVNFGINLRYLRQFIVLRLRFELPVWRKILKMSWPVALASLFSLIYFKADTLFLSVLPVNFEYATSNEAVVGIYGAPYKILEVLIAWPAIFMGLISPVLSRVWVDKKREEFGRVWQKAFDGLSLIIWPMVIGGMVLARPLIVLIAGQEFMQSAAVLRILIWATGIIFVTHLTTYSIIAIGKQKKMIKFYVIAAILAVFGYLMLIPMYSYFAAAWVTVGVEGFMLVATIWLLKRSIDLKVRLLVFGKAMMAAVVMGIILTFILNWNVFLLLVIGVGVYFEVLNVFSLKVTEIYTEKH